METELLALWRDIDQVRPGWRLERKIVTCPKCSRRVVELKPHATVPWFVSTGAILTNHPTVEDGSAHGSAGSDSRLLLRCPASFAKSGRRPRCKWRQPFRVDTLTLAFLQAIERDSDTLDLVVG